MTLQILVSTIDKGINDVAQLVLPHREGISYLVSWQHSTSKEIPVPLELKRDDVEIHNLDGRGVSRNRNNCLRYASGDICLIADDDCRYTHERLQCAIDTMEKNKDIDVATFQYSSKDGQKPYPSISLDLANPPKGYYVSSIEIVFRRTKVQNKLWFNELFGYGAPLSCGEEEILLQNAIKKGLKCQFFPIDIAIHEGVTNVISNIGKKNILMGRGAYIAITKPWTCIPRICLHCYRLKKKYNVPFWHGVKCMLSGAIYYIRHRNDKQSYQ